MKKKSYTKKDAIQWILDMSILSSVAHRPGEIIKKSPAWVREALQDVKPEDFNHVSAVSMGFTESNLEKDVRI